MSRDIIRNALENYLEIVAIKDSFEAAEALRLFDEQAVPRLRANDNLSLADLGNEIHNASCTVVHLNEEIGARLGEIAVQLWCWKEQAAPVEHELNDLRCACCGYMTYHREHMGCIRAAAPKMEDKAIVPIKATPEMINAALPDAMRESDEDKYRAIGEIVCIWDAMIAASTTASQKEEL